MDFKNPYVVSVLFIIAGYFTMVATWFYYVAAMHLIKYRKTMHWVAKLHAYPFVLVGVALDFILHIVFGTVFFLDIPREWLLTHRLQRYKRGSKNWRYHTAYWICKNLLNQFDEGHC